MSFMLMSRSKTETVFHGCLTPGQLTLILAMPHFGLDVIYVQIATILKRVAWAPIDDFFSKRTTVRFFSGYVASLLRNNLALC